MALRQDAESCENWEALIHTVKRRFRALHRLAQEVLQPPPDANLRRLLASFAVFFSLHQLVANVVQERSRLLMNTDACAHHKAVVLSCFCDDFTCVLFFTVFTVLDPA